MHDLGSVVPLATVVTDADGVETDAATAVLTITLPDGTTATPTVPATSSAGHYQVDYLPTLAGRHAFRWVFTGPNAAVGGSFHVEPAAPVGVVSLAEVKAHLNKTVTTDDDELRSFIAAATEVIESDPEIGVGAVVVRSFTERHEAGDSLVLSRTPVVELTTVEPWLTDGTTYDVAELRVNADTGIVERLDGVAFLDGPFAVTYTSGRAVVPANIRLAALEMIKHWWESQRGSGTGRPQLSAEPVIVVGGGYAIPTRVAQMLRAHRSVLGFA